MTVPSFNRAADSVADFLSEAGHAVFTNWELFPKLIKTGSPIGILANCKACIERRIKSCLFSDGICLRDSSKKF